MTEQFCILIIDDEPAELYLVAEILRHAGFDTIAVSSAHEARLAWEAHMTDIVAVVADSDLASDATGHELCREFQIEKPSLTTILIRDRGLNGAMIPNRREGFDLFQKPYSFSELVASIKSHVDETAGQAA